MEKKQTLKLKLKRRIYKTPKVAVPNPTKSLTENTATLTTTVTGI